MAAHIVFLITQVNKENFIKISFIPIYMLPTARMVVPTVLLARHDDEMHG
jgi:hypothetical protein